MKEVKKGVREDNGMKEGWDEGGKEGSERRNLVLVLFHHPVRTVPRRKKGNKTKILV